MTGGYLALDQGGHASRALVFDSRGHLCAAESVPIRTLRNTAGHIEHDPEELLGSLRQATAGACARLPAGMRLLAAGLATQRSSMVCWQRSTGAALSPVISWQDRRHAAWLAGLESHAATVRRLTGLVLSPHYGASKMRWCLDQLPAVRQAAGRGELVMGPLASFLACRLLDGQPLLADPANASRTLLWDLATRDWSPELLRLFDIPRAVLPMAVDTRHDYGSLPTPLGPVPLQILTGDQSAVPFAFGPLDAGTAFVNLGTGAFVRRPVAGRLPDAPGLLLSVVYSGPAGVDTLIEGTVNGAGSALDWLAAQEQMGEGDLLAAADAAERAGPEPPLFLNGIAGLGAPWWLSDFATRFSGAGPADTAGSRTLAVLESIAFLLQVNLQAMAPHCPPLQRLLVTGGLAANGYLCRCLATLNPAPVERVDDPEATARGLTVLVAGPVSRGWPLPARHRLDAPAIAGLAARFARWQAAMPPLSPAPAPGTPPSSA